MSVEDLAFEEWLAGLTDAEKLKLAPPLSPKFGLGTETHNSQLKGVWIKQQKESRADS